MVSADEVLKALARGGFAVSRVRGSHTMVKHQDGRWTTVPVHGNRDIDPHLLIQILREAGMTREEFLELLRGRRRCGAA